MSDGEMVLIAGVLLAAGLAASLFADRVRVPALVLFLGAGMALGSDGAGWLDFDDLIARTAGLLSRSSMAQWVLFRLDGGIDHILVDEAQDTSPPQWQVIERLVAEFTAGRPADRTSTIGRHFRTVPMPAGPRRSNHHSVCPECTSGRSGQVRRNRSFFLKYFR